MPTKKQIQNLKEEIIKKEYPEYYEKYSKYDKWDLINILVVKEDIINLHKKFKHFTKENNLK